LLRVSLFDLVHCLMRETHSQKARTDIHGLRERLPGFLRLI
jgi:hypothetical protein